MKIVIDIPEEDWEFIKETDGCRWSKAIIDGVINGTPLPKGHGDLISRDYTIQQIQKAKESNYNFNYNTLIDFIKALPSAERTAEARPIQEEFEREIEIANKDIDLMPEQEDYMRGYLGGILCAYRIVFGKNYEESEE